MKVGGERRRLRPLRRKGTPLAKQPSPRQSGVGPSDFGWCRRLPSGFRRRLQVLQTFYADNGSAAGTFTGVRFAAARICGTDDGGGPLGKHRQRTPRWWRQ